MKRSDRDPHGPRPSGNRIDVSTPSSSTEPAPPAEPITIPDHELLQLIATGSYGQVWLARNVVGTTRAVKVISRQRFEDDRPFEREFHGIRKYEPISRSHEGLVDILQVGSNEAGGYFYYVMELADDVSAPGAPYQARTLQSDLRSACRLPAHECVRIGVELAEAVAYLHERSLVHRDIKPSNIIFVENKPKLADIGLVTDVDATYSFVGTEGFIPREGPGTPAADIYSLGKVLYEISTGFDRNQYPDLPADIGGQSDRKELLELNEVVLKACATDPKKRYASAREMAGDLRLLLRGASVRRLRLLERRVTVLLRASAVVLALALLVSIGFYQAHREKKAATSSLSRMHVAEGARDMDEGELFDALLSFTKALELDSGDQQRERAHRIRISSVLQHCPRPVGLFAPEHGKTLDAGFCLDGTGIWTIEDRTLRIFNSTSGELMHARRHPHEVVLTYPGPDGKRIVCVTSDHSGHVWDVATGSYVVPPFPHEVYRTILGDYSLAMKADEIRLMKWEDVLWEKPFKLPKKEMLLRLGFTGMDSNVVIEVRLEDPKTGRILFTNDHLDTPMRDAQEFDEESQVLPFLGGQAVLGLGFYADPSREVTTDHEVVFDDVTVKSPDLKESPSGETSIPVVEGNGIYGIQGWAVYNSGRGQKASVGLGDLLTLTAPNVGEPFLALAYWQSNRFTIAEGKKLEFSVRLVNAVQAWPFLSLLFYASSQIDREFLGRLPFHCYDVSPDGQTIAALTDFTRQTVGLRPLVGGSSTHLRLVHKASVRQVLFNPNGESVATATKFRISLWDTQTGERLPTFYRNKSAITGMCFSPDGTMLAVARYGKVILRDLSRNSARELPTRQARWPFVSFSPEGSRIVAPGPNNTVKIWDAVTGESLLTIPLDQVPHLAGFSPDGHRVVTLGERDSARVWDAATGEAVTPSLPHHLLAGLPEFHPAGHLLMTLDPDNGARIWNLSKHALAKLAVPPARGPVANAVSPDGKVAAMMGERGDIALWSTDRQSGPQLRPIQERGSLKRVLFDASSKWLLVERQDTAARWWDISAGEPLTPWLKTHYDVENPQLSLAGISPYDSWPETDLLHVAQLLASRSLDSQEGHRHLAVDEVMDVWGILTNSYAPVFSVSTTEVRDWHDQEARRAKQTWNWWSALFHLNRVIALDPTDSEVHVRRDYAKLALSNVRQQGASYVQTRLVIPPRPPQADASMIVLTDFFNQTIKQELSVSGVGNTFGNLPAGIQEFSGVPFDVRGIVRLAVTNIPVHRLCTSLSFLHATAYPSQLYTQVGRYIVHYANGSKEEIPLRYGVDIAGYRIMERRPLHLEPSKGPLRSTLAWAGTNPDVDADYRPFRLFRSTWENPYPTKEVARIDFLSDPHRGAPFLIAITVN